jgi:hypothetical protein
MYQPIEVESIDLLFPPEVVHVQLKLALKHRQSTTDRADVIMTTIGHKRHAHWLKALHYGSR